MEKYIKLEEMFNVYDNVLDGITYDELITTVQSNVQYPDAKSVMATYDELLKMRINEARYELKANMNKILREV